MALIAALHGGVELTGALFSMPIRPRNRLDFYGQVWDRDRDLSELRGHPGSIILIGPSNLDADVNPRDLEKLIGRRVVSISIPSLMADESEMMIDRILKARPACVLLMTHPSVFGIMIENSDRLTSFASWRDLGPLFREPHPRRPFERQSKFGANASRPSERRPNFDAAASRPSERRSNFDATANRPSDRRPNFGAAASRPPEPRSDFVMTARRAFERRFRFVLPASQAFERRSVFIAVALANLFDSYRYRRYLHNALFQPIPSRPSGTTGQSSGAIWYLPGPFLIREPQRHAFVRVLRRLKEAGLRVMILEGPIAPLKEFRDSKWSVAYRRFVEGEAARQQVTIFLDDATLPIFLFGDDRHLNAFGKRIYTNLLAATLTDKQGRFRLPRAGSRVGMQGGRMISFEESYYAF